MCADVQEQHQDLLLQLLLMNSAVNPDVLVDSDAEEEMLPAGADQMQKSLPGAALLSNVQAAGYKDSGTKHKRTVAEVSKLCLWIVFSLCYLSESKLSLIVTKETLNKSQTTNCNPENDLKQ